MVEIGKNTPALTVLMTVYNAENYLNKAIESILNQTFTDFEFLIINDGSKDSSLEIIQDYAQKDARIRVISRENKGFIASLREGMSEVRGDLVARMDADDVALPSRLEKQYSYLQSHPDCMVVGCQVQVVDEADVFLHVDPRPMSDVNVRLFLTYGCALSGPTVIFRKSMLDSVGGFDENELPAEDYACWVKLAEKYQDKTIVNLPDVLYLYRETSTGISLSNKKAQIQKTIDIGDGYRRNVIKSGCKFLSLDIQKGWLDDANRITDKEAREQLIRVYYMIQTWFRNDMPLWKRPALKNQLKSLTRKINPDNTPYIEGLPKRHTFPSD